MNMLAPIGWILHALRATGKVIILARGNGA